MNSEKRQSRFVLCVRNNASEDLELRKVYQVLPDRTAAQEGYARVIDESGEDYLYPAEYFVAVRLPSAIAKEFVSPPDRTVQPVGGGRNRSVKARLRAVRG